MRSAGEDVPPGRKKIILSGGMSDGTVMERTFSEIERARFFSVRKMLPNSIQKPSN